MMEIRALTGILLTIGLVSTGQADIVDLMAGARYGDPGDQYLVGCAWIRGEIDGFPDAGEAMISLRQSADQGYAPAQGLIGFLLLESAGTDAEMAEALYFLQTAADGKCALGFTGLGLAAINGWGMAKAPEAGFKYLKEAAEAGEPLGQFAFSQVLEFGIGTSPDEGAANHWLEMACRSRFDPAEADLGLHYWHGIGQKADPVTALIHLQNTAAAGYSPAQFHLAALIWSGEAGRSDQAKSISWLKKSARSDYPPSLRALGLILATGTGIDQDSAEARSLLEKAASLGDEPAALALSHRVWESTTLPEDIWWTPEITDRLIHTRGSSPLSDRDNAVNYIAARELLAARY